MTIPIIKPDNLMHYIQYIHHNLRKSFVSSLKNTALYTCQKLTKHFQPELFDDSDALTQKYNKYYVYLSYLPLSV